MQWVITTLLEEKARMKNIDQQPLVTKTKKKVDIPQLRPQLRPQLKKRDK